MTLAGGGQGLTGGGAGEKKGLWKAFFYVAAVVKLFLHLFFSLLSIFI
jgi:hypothetical protein